MIVKKHQHDIQDDEGSRSQKDEPQYNSHTPDCSDECERVRFADGELIRGDCSDAIEEFPNESIDLVFTSPPYFTGKDYDPSICIDDFIEKIKAFQKKLYPKVKTGGSLCWQVGSHVKNTVTTPLDFLVHQTCAQFPQLKLRNRVIWTFEHGAHAKKRLSGRYETVLWYTKGDHYVFNLDEIRIPQKYPGKKHYKGPNRGQLSGNPRGKNPGDVWAIPNVKANHVEKTDHPCQFPVALVARFIRALTPLGGTVLDPFAGSASTAIASLETGRRFFCIELNQRYFDISKLRIKNWYSGACQVREDVPSAAPNPNTAVATRPSHFSAEVVQ